MKKSIVFLLVVISLFACVSTVFAKNASELIGTITSYVEEIQRYPEALRDACGTDMFNQKLGEFTNLIIGANDAMAEAGLPNSLNLWAVYSAVTSNISDCSFFTSALSKADWSREELDRIGYQFGLYDSKEMGTAGTARTMCRGDTWVGMTKGEVYQKLGEPTDSANSVTNKFEVINPNSLVVKCEIRTKLLGNQFWKYSFSDGANYNYDIK